MSEIGHQMVRENLSRFVDLTSSEFERFTQHLVHKSLKKKEVLLQEGAVCHDAFFIYQGCLRYYFNVEGEDKTGQFFFEGAWYTDFESYITGQPSSENIQALETSELLLLSRKSLLQLFSEIPKLERFGRLIAENAFLGVKARNNSFLNQTPEERYQALLKERPKVVHRIPQHYIASYLGIKPESLSRIRKRMADSD
ncbi:MAG: cyclic nucleotide-binding domain-containing protein [Tunicatimonas sp.]|uniref:Crp/Fnr family transcriptional regulator n=1 Tax=Tunicatimonas sp. TaxID=1940096 RepID=UPI003C74DA18